MNNVTGLQNKNYITMDKSDAENDDGTYEGSKALTEADGKDE